MRGVGSARFVGRWKDLWATHSGLQASEAVIITGKSGLDVTQVRGMGGIGKSLLAEEYALRFSAAYPGGVFWLRAYGNDDSEPGLGPEERDAELAARIESYELAYRMQMAAPEALDVEREPAHIQQLYGLHEDHCGHIARQCLTARRLVERGVRFVQIYSGGMENLRSWDGHHDIYRNHSQFAGETDQPMAALLTDLEQRGLLEDTLVIWGGEFGRLPVAQIGAAKPGRDHNPHCFTSWMAGGGVKGGVSYGESDELGFKAAVNPVSVNDFHATILHLLGLEHERLTYKYNGRQFRLTDVAGTVLHEIIA